MSRRLLLLPVFALVLAQAEARPVVAPAAGPDGGSLRDQVPLQEARPREPGPANLKEATEIAIERYGGEVSAANTVERDGRRVHEIRLLLDDGTVRTVRIDPQTGAVILPREQR